MSIEPIEATPPRPSLLVRTLRTVLRALLFAFVIGFAIGTWIRCEAERGASPALQYLGDRESLDATESARPA